jgi:hypothetical protein
MVLPPAEGCRGYQSFGHNKKELNIQSVEHDDSLVHRCLMLLRGFKSSFFPGVTLEE